MKQIVTKLYFNKANGLNIPLAIENPSISGSISSPNNSGLLDNLCIEIEKKLLLNAFGLSLYNEFKTALLNLDSADQKFKDLVNGVEYDGKVWVGLKYELGFIAQKVYETYITQTNEHLTAIGNAKPNAENATLVTPAYKIANASQSFAKQYQGGYLVTPNCYNGVTDWFGGNNDIEVSFYQYLRDKQADFINLDLSKFAIYKVKNSFGI